MISWCGRSYRNGTEMFRRKKNKRISMDSEIYYADIGFFPMKKKGSTRCFYDWRERWRKKEDLGNWVKWRVLPYSVPKPWFLIALVSHTSSSCPIPTLDIQVVAILETRARKKSDRGRKIPESSWRGLSFFPLENSSVSFPAWLIIPRQFNWGIVEVGTSGRNARVFSSPDGPLSVLFLRLLDLKDPRVLEEFHDRSRASQDSQSSFFMIHRRISFLFPSQSTDFVQIVLAVQLLTFWLEILSFSPRIRISEILFLLRDEYRKKIFNRTNISKHNYDRTINYALKIDRKKRKFRSNLTDKKIKNTKIDWTLPFDI